MRGLGGVVGALGLAGLARPETAEATLPKRPFGKTGWNATIYAVGTAEIPADAEAERALTTLLEAGVNYVDTAPSYTGTRSEKVVGRVLRGRRDKVFLATKTLERTAARAYQEVTESLARLNVETIDLLQIHAVNDMATLDQVLTEGGAIRGLERAVREGRVRHIGITGHTRPEVILTALDRYPFASVLIPLSALDAHLSDFATEVLPKARKVGAGVIGMKALKGMEIATGQRFEPEPLLRYTWSLPIDTLAIGLRTEREVAENLRYARNFRPLTAPEMRELETKVKPSATAQNLWWKRT